MVLRAFRCQRHGYSHAREILASVCAELYYQGRYVWLSSCREVNLAGITLRGPNRIRYRLVSTVDYKCRPLVQKENKHVVVTTELAIAAMPIIKSKRRTLFLFVTPEFISSHRWDTAPSNLLSPEEIAYLVGKPQPVDLRLVSGALCRFRHLVDEDDVLTKEGRRILAQYNLVQ